MEEDTDREIEDVREKYEARLAGERCVGAAGRVGAGAGGGADSDREGRVVTTTKIPLGLKYQTREIEVISGLQWVRALSRSCLPPGPLVFPPRFQGDSAAPEGRERHHAQEVPGADLARSLARGSFLPCARKPGRALREARRSSPRACARRGALIAGA
jgi:hypothetical protein